MSRPEIVRGYRSFAHRLALAFLLSSCTLFLRHAGSQSLRQCQSGCTATRKPPCCSPFSCPSVWIFRMSCGACASCLPVIVSSLTNQVSQYVCRSHGCGTATRSPLFAVLSFPEWSLCADMAVGFDASWLSFVHFAYHSLWSCTCEGVIQIVWNFVNNWDSFHFLCPDVQLHRRQKWNAVLRSGMDCGGCHADSCTAARNAMSQMRSC